VGYKKCKSCTIIPVIQPEEHLLASYFTPAQPPKLIQSGKTSRFWPRVRARALRLPVFLSSLPRKLGPPTSKAFFFPLDHMQTEEAMKYEVPCPRPALRSFPDPSGNILGSKLCTGATKRPNFFRFFLFCMVFGSFLFVIFFFLFSSYILNCLLYYRHEISVILRGFLRGSSLC
jgi:hypothetical protein